MTWLAHQAHGFFGFSADGQPRWKGAVDVEEAMAEVGDVVDAFFAWLSWQDAPPFTGGVLDAWPARMAQGLAMAKREWAAIQAHVRKQAKQEGAR